MMTKGCKIWLWIVLIANALSLVIGVVSIAVLGVVGIYTVAAEILMILSVCLLLFKKKRIGFYIMVAVCLGNLVVNIVNGTNILVAVLMAVFTPALTFFFIRKNHGVIQ